MAQIQQFTTPEEEFANISKKAALHPSAVGGSADDKKEAVRTILKAHITKMADSPVAPTDQLLEGLDHKEQIEVLVHVAFAHGILRAVEVARAQHDPHLLDEFHDALVDRFYEKLVREGKIYKERL